MRLGQITLLTASGLLDATTYLLLRDSIIKAALDDPRAVIVDVSDLLVPRESALAVFTSARWHVERWPEVPILLVCDDPYGRDAVARNGVTRYVPVYATIESACNALALVRSSPGRRRARVELPARRHQLATFPPVRRGLAERLVDAGLDSGGEDRRDHFRRECSGTHRRPRRISGWRPTAYTVTVAVEDTSHSLANIREPTEVTNAPTGLGILNALCRMWGNSPMPSGKTVWAVIGPENRL